MLLSMVMMMEAARIRMAAFLDKPPSWLALITAMGLGVLWTMLSSDLLSIPVDAHFWLFEGVLTLDPLRLALFGFWLLLWAVCAQMAVVSAKAFNRCRL